MRQEGSPFISEANLDSILPPGKGGPSNRLLTMLSKDFLTSSEDKRVEVEIAVKLKHLRSLLGTKQSGIMSVPFSQWHQKKQHQWMILSRDFVEYMKSSPLSSYMAAYSEFVFIPDESYFSMIALNAYTIHKATVEFVKDADFIERMQREHYSSQYGNGKRVIQFAKQPKRSRRLHIMKSLRRLKSKFLRVFGKSDKQQYHAGLVIAPMLKESLATYAYLQTDVCPDRKRFLHFGRAWHPRLLDETDERKLVIAVGKHRMAFARKLVNNDGTAPVAKEIDRIRKMDWFHTFS